MKIKNGMNITIGADPEFFLKEKLRPVSAHDYLPIFGGKHNPLQVPNGAIQVDGTAVEFNITPAENEHEFVSHVDQVLLTLRDKIDSKYDFHFFPTQTYSEDYFATIPFEAKELGCDPDFDAYTLQPNPKPNVESTMRTGSGHIHVGWTSGLDVNSQAVMLDCAVLVKQLDAVLYPASRVWDKDTKRSEMYGKPGAFRVKPYGVEYRVLSNAWLRYKPVQRWIFNSTVRAFELLTEGVQFDDTWKYIKGDPYMMSRHLDKMREHGLPELPSVYSMGPDGYMS